MYRKYKLGKRLLLLANNFYSTQPKKKLANVGQRHEPIVTPSIYLYSLSLYMSKP